MKLYFLPNSFSISMGIIFQLSFWLLFFMNLLCTLTAQNSYAPYYEKTINAYTKMAEGNYSLAVELYEKAFSNDYPFPDDLANLRDCYLALGDTTLAVNCVKRMITCGWQLYETYPVVGLAPWKNKIGAFDTTQINYITNLYQTLRQSYLQQIVPSENAYLERIVVNEIFCEDIRDGEFGKIKKLSRSVFAQNAIILCELLKNKELDRKEVDVWNHTLLLTALVHCAKSIGLKKYKSGKTYAELMDLLKKEVLKGNLYPDVYASIYDIVYWFNYHKSYYGRQISFDPKTGKNYCVEIDDPIGVDVRRAEIGLPPVWAFCQKYNITPPANYKY